MLNYKNPFDYTSKLISIAIEYLLFLLITSVNSPIFASICIIIWRIILQIILSNWLKRVLFDSVWINGNNVVFWSSICVIPAAICIKTTCKHRIVQEKNMRTKCLSWFLYIFFTLTSHKIDIVLVLHVILASNYRCNCQKTSNGKLYRTILSNANKIFVWT